MREYALLFPPHTLRLRKYSTHAQATTRRRWDGLACGEGSDKVVMTLDELQQVQISCTHEAKCRCRSESGPLLRE